MRIANIAKTWVQPGLWLGAVLALVTHAQTNAPNTFLLTGKVVDMAGKPVADAVVERYGYDHGLPYFGIEMERLDRVTSDESGAFEFRVSREMIMLVARKSGMSVGWLEFMAAPGIPHTLTLTPPSVLGGVVVDESGKPVPNADVFVSAAFSETAGSGNRRWFSYLTGKLARDCFHAPTDADGRFRIENFPTNNSAQLDVRVAGKALKQREMRVRANLGPDTMPYQAGQTDIRLVMEPAGSIEGSLTFEPAGSPLPVARLTLQPDEPGFFAVASLEPTGSAPDGSFVIKDVPAGSYRVRAVFGTNTVPDWVAESVSVSVDVGQATRGVQITAQHGGILDVAVAGKEDHSPLREVSVNAIQAGYQTVAASESNGVARLRLPPGEYQLYAFKVGRQQQNANATVEAGKTNRVEIELALPVKLTGVVHRPDGTPAAGLEVRILGAFSSTETLVKTDANGRFEMEGSTGRGSPNNMIPCLLVRDPEHDLAVAQDIEEEEPAPFDLRLAPALTIAGHAECDGKPVTNATATLIFWTGNSGMHLSDLCTGTNVPGRFEISALPPGRKYGVLVSAPGFGQKAIYNLEVQADPGRQELDPVELKVANLPLAGQVVDADDKPVAGASVNLNGDGQPGGFTRTDREGRFRFEHVCEGSIQLFASAGERNGNVSAQGGDTNVVVKLGERNAVYPGATAHKLKGVVTNPDGKPAADVPVTVFPAFGSSRWIKTGTNGEFSLSWQVEPWQAQQGGTPLLVARDLARNLAAAEDIPEEATNLDLQLKPALMFAGRVEDPGGKPLAGAEVGVWLLASRTYSQVDGRPATTGANGGYEIKALPAGQQFIVFAKANGRGRGQRQVSTDAESSRVELDPFVLKLADQVLAGQVVNENEKPVSGVNVMLSGEDQPEGNLTTDSKGRFHFRVCEGTVRLFCSGQNGYANVTVEAGDTNVVIHLTSSGGAVQPAPARASLKGKPLPDLTAVGLTADAVPAGKPALICLFDAEQRPSRHCVSQLVEQAGALKQQGVAVAVIQAALASDDAFKQWQEANTVPFPVGRVAAKNEQTKWATSVDSLPWLILVNAEHRVTAEGFTLDELDARLKQPAK